MLMNRCCCWDWNWEGVKTTAAPLFKDIHRLLLKATHWPPTATTQTTTTLSIFKVVFGSVNISRRPAQRIALHRTNARIFCWALLYSSGCIRRWSLIFNRHGYFCRDRILLLFLFSAARPALIHVLLMYAAPMARRSIASKSHRFVVSFFQLYPPNFSYVWSTASNPFAMGLFVCCWSAQIDFQLDTINCCPQSKGEREREREGREQVRIKRVVILYKSRSHQ